ncbi:unnamed protein product [Staurois parvus]|uniref:Uncharacterized protein n=1 Tax=Staurois parvus TaxID=386267 RepID=A0ABN9FXB5_9NEOB|nr:unnamed protein product [Staurois parvus]
MRITCLLLLCVHGIVAQQYDVPPQYEFSTEPPYFYEYDEHSLGAAAAADGIPCSDPTGPPPVPGQLRSTAVHSTTAAAEPAGGPIPSPPLIRIRQNPQSPAP